jgi:hypothetical protein
MPNNSIVRNPIPVVIDNTQATKYEFKGIPVSIEGNCTITGDLIIGSGRRNLTGEINAIKTKLNEVIAVVNEALSRNIRPL